MSDTSTSPTLRDYQADDIAHIVRIYTHYVRNSVATFDLTPPSTDEFAAKLEAMQALGHPVTVAHIGGEFAGYAYASFYRPRHAYRYTCENSIYLDPKFTGRGLGTVLLEDLLIKARASGFKQMIGVISEGMEPSIKLHQKAGFEIMGRFPNLGYKFDKWIGIVHVQRAL